jgi:hypothetical protein
MGGLPTRRARAAYALTALGVGLAAFFSADAGGHAQLSERAHDPSGFSIREPRIQVIHSEDEARAGTSMHLQRTDPWLAYEMGHSYFEREWGRQDGVFATLEPRPLAAAVNSCAMCHNLPYRSAGYGGNVADPPGFGQNAPHLFGIGLIETIALQIRQQIMVAYDTNHNGFLDVPAETKGHRAVVEASPGVKVDFGTLEDLDGDGWPGLNGVMKVTVVDAQGSPKPPRPDGTPARLGDPGVAGYDLTVGFLSSTRSDHQFSSLREFSIGVMKTVMGLSVDDHTVLNDGGEGRDVRAHDGWAETSNAGAAQRYFPLAAGGCDGRCLPVSEGEIDLLEWLLLNHPSPAMRTQTRETKRGRLLMDALGCTSCHVANWVIQAGDEKLGLTGDRRFFDLEVIPNPASGQLQGQLHSLTTSRVGARGEIVYTPRRGGYVVRGVFTDLRHHDVVDRFYQYSYTDGRLRVNRTFRTSPLWGVGSTAPYGHDGRSQSIDSVIRRHGGEAESSAKAYVSAPAIDREAVTAFLESLTLYQPDELPTDLNGDGKIEEHFNIQREEVGPERFWTELLFRVAPRYRGWVSGSDGVRYFSYELLNAHEAYGRTLEALIDADGDGVPDVAVTDAKARSPTVSRRAP